MKRAGYLVVIVLTGLCSSVLSQTPDTTAQPSVAPKAQSSSILSGDLKNEATYIKADSLQLKSIERVFEYTGSVEVRRGDMTITSDRLDGRYNQKSQIETLTAKGSVVITRGPDLRATSGQALFSAAENTVLLTDNPELLQNENVLTADQFKIFLQDNRSIAQGQVRVKVAKQSGAMPAFVKKEPSPATTPVAPN